jgi:predicted transposase YbfD/YdcC
VVSLSKEENEDGLKQQFNHQSMPLIEQLKTIADSRGKRGQRYPLWLLLFVSLLGSLCGYWGYRPLEAFCRQYHSTLCELLSLETTTPLLPSYSTFRRVFQQVDAQGLVDAYNAWGIEHPPAVAALLWSIDGKSIKCTAVGGNSSEQNFACLVSVYGQSVGVIRLQLMYNAKASEIAVARELLAAVTTAEPLRPVLPSSFSLDALHAQVDTLALVAEQGCGYLVSLKANQKSLYTQMQALQQQATPLSEASHCEALHGRQTERWVRVYAAPAQLPQRWLKAGIKRVIWVTRRGVRNGKLFEEQQCYLSNRSFEATQFLEITRSHWQIENGLHWVKDVTLQEDDPPRRGGFAPINWAVVNSFLITFARRLGSRTLPDCIRQLANQVHQVFHWLT